MRWNKEKDEELRSLISSGKRHDEIKDIFNVSIRSIANRCHRLGLKTNFFTETNCKQCNIKIITYTKRPQIFCSSSCSASFNNSGRVMSDDTKEKIREKIINIQNYNVKKNEKINVKKNIARRCRFCNNFTVTQKHKIICESCKTNYYKLYRPICEFDFNVNDFPEEFSLELIKLHGWYSPSNKGNNLNGVSKDHLYSVRDGFVNKVDSNIIKHPANCKLILHKDNNHKSFYSSITLDELLLRIDLWNKKYK